MSGADFGLALSVFLACAVEAVEALTIVLAVGNARSWPSALGGSAAAAALLGLAVALFGSALAQVPIDTLRVLTGLLLLAVGLQWLRKAVLRAAGRKALHDELGEYAHETEAALAAGGAQGAWDAYSFTVAFKGVALEGFEVALIVITLGGAHQNTGLAAAAAGVAILAVIAAGVAVRAPLARVPENTMKYAVGVMLCSFGVFWTCEGAGLSWPGGDAALLLLIPLVLGASLLAVGSLRRTAAP